MNYFSSVFTVCCDCFSEVLIRFYIDFLLLYSLASCGQRRSLFTQHICSQFLSPIGREETYRKKNTCLEIINKLLEVSPKGNCQLSIRLWIHWMKSFISLYSFTRLLPKSFKKSEFIYWIYQNSHNPSDRQADRGIIKKIRELLSLYLVWLEGFILTLWFFGHI